METSLNALVIGGGIGGLATAIALRQQGIDVTVLEQAPELSEIGAGLQVSANAMWVLADMGLAEEVKAVGVAAKSIRFHHLDTGDDIFETVLGAGAAERYGQPFHQIHRADLLGILARALPQDSVRLGSRVVSVVDNDSQASVSLDDGTVMNADLVIGADGINSVVRGHVLDQIAPTSFSGVLGWRAMLTKEQVEDLGIDHSCDCWIGPGRSVVTYWLRSGELFNVIGFVPAGEVHRESWTDLGEVSDMRKSFANSCEIVERLLRKIDRAFITGVYYHEPAPIWSKGRFVLLGDAAHATVPYLAQGACQSIEDAAVLARLVARHGTDYQAAFSEYEARRKPRTTKVQSVARGTEKWWHEADPVAIDARDGMFRGLTRIDPLTETVWRWLYEHNPIEALDRPPHEALGLSTLRDDARFERDASRRAAELWRNAFTPEDHAGGWKGLRVGYERFLRTHSAPSGEFRVTDVVPGLLVSSHESGPVALHVHGGGFMFGSAASSLGLTQRIAKAIDGSALAVEYRLAPEEPFPAALDDVVAAYRWLLDEGFDASRIVLSGESAGGGLVLCAVQEILAAGLPRPAGIWVMSPLADLSLGSESIDACEGLDPVVNRDLLTQMSGAYAQGADPRDPRLSAAFVNFESFPPLLIHAAENEALRDDARRVHHRAIEAGVDAALHLVPDSVHIFGVLDFLPESRAAIQELADAVKSWTTATIGTGSRL